MGLSTIGKNRAVDGVVDLVDIIKLHNGDPGAAGTSNAIAGATAVAAYAAAAAGQGDLTAAVEIDVTVVDVPIQVSYWSIWHGAVFILSKPFATAETYSQVGTNIASVTSALVTAQDAA